MIKLWIIFRVQTNQWQNNSSSPGTSHLVLNLALLTFFQPSVLLVQRESHLMTTCFSFHLYFLAPLVQFRVSSRKETFTISKQLFHFVGRRESYSSSDWVILPYFGYCYSIILDTSLSKPGCFDFFFFIKMRSIVFEINSYQFTIEHTWILNTSIQVSTQNSEHKSYLTSHQINHITILDLIFPICEKQVFISNRNLELKE